MSKYRLCLNCGKKITLFQSIFHNKCCSYKCDCIYEQERDKQEREDWERMMIDKSLKKNNSGTNNKKENETFEVVNNEELKKDNVLSKENQDEFYGYCLTDDKNNEDYTF